MPNGIITKYEVFYGLSNSIEPLSNIMVGLRTNFTTPNDLQPDRGYNFTVRAYTIVGPGEPSTVITSSKIIVIL